MGQSAGAISGSAADGWEELFWGVFNMSTNPMALHDRHRVLLEPNRALQRLLGGSRDQLVGQKIDAFLPPEERPRSASDWRHLWDVGTYAGERHIVRLDGKRVWVQYAGRIAEVEGRRLALVVLLRVRLDDQNARPRAPGELTRREREILHLIALGYTSTRIAQKLMIANDTVRTHIRNAMAKTGARTRAQLVAIALADRHIEQKAKAARSRQAGGDGLQGAGAPTRGSSS